MSLDIVITLLLGVVLGGCLVLFLAYLQWKQWISTASTTNTQLSKIEKTHIPSVSRIKTPISVVIYSGRLMIGQGEVVDTHSMNEFDVGDQYAMLTPC